MTLKEYKIKFTNTLAPIYDEKEIESFFYILLESFHKLKRIDFALNPNLELNSEEISRWETSLKELEKEKPVQYILGETEFFGLPFFVNENTLIPRPETEELVSWILQSSKFRIQNSKLRILDIGTGTGCIAISLAKNLPEAEVFALDVSEKAIEVAKKNATINNVNITFLHQSILETEDLEQQFDIIVSNPPYVRNLEKEEIKKNVLDYEPHLALFVEDTDALLFYRRITQLAKKNLTASGELYFEINQYLGNEMTLLLENLGFKNIELRKDIYENDRMTRATL
ncbi:MAG: peptide chain release factor N(5)-glutamine methyltransferase [Limnohabitans sp.]|nr:peptide chain release factor N(5)-glutamine methyltransferase [Limnohabitans sp.]